MSYIPSASPVIFQLTTSQGGRLLPQARPAQSMSFNSRPHKEVDTSTPYSIDDPAIFQLTTSQGGRRYCIYYALFPIPFQLTTSQGGRRWILLSPSGASPFNSRPHKEVDLKAGFDECMRVFFQLTTSQGGRQERIQNAVMEKFFQLTTSQGGRLSYAISSPQFRYLSTHDLTRRSTAEKLIVKPPHDLSTHDLTRRST